MSEAKHDERAEDRPSYTLHPVHGVVWATFFGMPAAAGIVMAINYARVGHKSAAPTAVVIGLLATVALFAIPIPDEMPAFLAWGPLLVIVYIVASCLQFELIAAHTAKGGVVASAWSSVGIGVLCIPLALGILVVLAVLLEAKEASPTQAPRKNQPPVDRFSNSFQLKDEQQLTGEQPKQKPLPLAEDLRNKQESEDHSNNPNPTKSFALEFDGSKSHVILPRTFFDGRHPITLEAWVELGEKGAGHIISNMQKAGTSLELYKRHLVSNVVNNQQYVAGISADKLTDQETHVAVVFDGKTIKLFINGKKTGEKSFIGLHRQSSLAYMIGGNPQAEVGPPIDLYTGLIDEVRISRIARYDDDFTPQRRFSPDKDTMGLYHFDEGEGIVAYDSSGNNYHGLIVDAKWIERE